MIYVKKPTRLKCNTSPCHDWQQDTDVEQDLLSKKHFSEIDRRAATDMLEVLIEPFLRCLSSFVA